MAFTHYQPFAIISAERHTLSARENNERTAELLEELQDLKGVALKEVIGYWQGKPERSILVLDTKTENNTIRPIIGAYLDYLADAFDQDSVLFVDSTRRATLSDGTQLGTFKGTTFDTASQAIAFAELQVNKSLTVCPQLNTVYECQ